jgi:hypothetical protein
MQSLKILTAAAAAATFSLAFAQGTPPTPATDPAVGAGQRSTQNTPMGTTGTPATNQGTMSGSTGSTTTNQATTSPSTSQDMSNQSGSMRVARADRN